MKTQSELVRALRKELAAKDKELADQKWVFDQFLRSPSWRLTAPFRWVVNQFRALRNGAGTTRSANPERTEHVEEPGLATGTALEIKDSYTTLCLAGLESFLISGSTLQLPQATKPEISIVLVLFNRAELTLACLRSIAENYNEEIEVVIVDNSSSDRTSRLLDRLRGARVFRNESNRHFLAAANQAAAECRGDYILFLNNDAQLVPGALQSALRTIKASPDIGAVGAKIISIGGTLQEAGSIVWQDGSCTGYGRGDDPFAPMYSFRRDVDYCSGAFLLTPRKTWELLGGFDNAFAPAYYEEVDYCMRLWSRGLRVVYEPCAAILHYEFGSSASAEAAMSLQARHQQMFAKRHQHVLNERNKPGTESPLEARSRNAERRVLFIDDSVPHHWLGSGFPRANAFISALLKQGYFITLFPTAGISEPWDVVYSDFPREVEVMMGMGTGLLEAFLRNRKGYYCSLVVSRPHNMERLAPLLQSHPDWFENVQVIYDAEALFASRNIGLRKLAGKSMSEREIQNEFAAEVCLTKSAHRVISVSENDRKVFQAHGVERVEVLGLCAPPAPGKASFESRTGFLFVGAVHEELSPNGDSLIWFLSEVFPRIRQKLGDIPVTIAGVNKSERIHSLASPPVRIIGYVSSLDELYEQSRVFIAPTRYAAGVPHKVNEAAAHGLPVVATQLLADQLGWTERELAIASDAESFASRSIEIYTDAEKWARLRQAALERVIKECSMETFEESVRRIFNGRETSSPS